MKWISILISLLYSAVCSAQVIENPVFDRTDIPQFHIDKIKVTKDSTFVYCTYHVDYGYYGSSIINISPEIYLEDASTGNKYFPLRLEGFPFSPKLERFKQSEMLHFLMVFQRISNSNVLNLIGTLKETKFNINGISLTEGVDTIYNDMSIERAGTLSSWARYYASTEDFKMAIEKESQAMNINKKWFGRVNRHYERSVSMLGYYCFMIRNYDAAIAYLSEDLQIIKEIAGEKYPGYAITVSALASCYDGKREYVKALHLYKEALDMARKNTDIKDIDIAMMLVSIAWVYLHMGDFPRATKYAEDGYNLKKIYLKADDEDLIATMSLLSRLYAYTNPLKGYEIEQNGYDLLRNKYGNTHPSTIKSLSDLGIACVNIKRYGDALQYTKKALELSINNPDVKEVTKGNVLHNIAQIYECLYMYEEAIRYEYMSLEKYKDEYPIHTAHSYKYLAKLYAKCYDFEKALDFSSKSIELYSKSMLNEMRNMTSSQKYLYWKDNHSLFDLDFPYYVSKLKNHKSISQLYDIVLYKKGILRNDNYEDVSWKSIRDSLDNRSLAIEFISFLNLNSNETEVFALTIKKGYDYPHMTKLFDLSQFNKIMTSTISVKEKNQLFANLLWKPIFEELLDVENIYFSPTGLLHTIAIEYLPINNKNSYNIYRVSSTGLLPRTIQRDAYKSATLFGGLEYESSIKEDSILNNEKRSGFSYLHNTYSEVMEISKLLHRNGIGTKIFTGEEGTEKQLRNLSNKKTDILHLSTHGMNIRAHDVKRWKDLNNFIFLQEDQNEKFFYEENALSRSFLVLSGGNKLVQRGVLDLMEDDGIITALEISKLDLHHIDLVVLSACETAQGTYGDDDSILGLQRSFKKAGVNTILLSLDKVDDEATKILMVEFYRNLMSGKSKHQSLKEAQKYLRSVENGKYDDPKYWASFIMLDGLN